MCCSFMRRAGERDVTPLYILLDYKGRFGAKWSAAPYRSGFDRDRLSRALLQHGFEARYLRFSDVDFRTQNWNQRFVLYASSEDWDLHYKGFIEDILLGLRMQGAVLIPRFSFFRAHHNKVFMEILRDVIGSEAMKTIRSRYYGTLEEAAAHTTDLAFPQVLKPAAGAMSTGVARVDSGRELLGRAAKLSRVVEPLRQLRELVRAYRHRGYARESWHRRKFVVQDFIPGLQSDWKVLVYDKKYFALYRLVRPADFRASGSGRFTYRTDVPREILDFAELVFHTLSVPFLSLDIAVSGNAPHLFEFQAIDFGTRTIDRAEYFFQRHEGAWSLCRAQCVVEDEVAASVAAFLGAGSRRQA